MSKDWREHRELTLDLEEETELRRISKLFVGDFAVWHIEQNLPRLNPDTVNQELHETSICKPQQRKTA